MSGATVLLATNAEVWWDNPVKAATAGDVLTSGTIYVLSPAAADIVHTLAQTGVYLLLLCGAALFDLQRKNF